MNFATSSIAKTALALLAVVGWTAAKGAEAPVLFVRSSTYAGYANILRIGISADGVNFTDLFTTPTLTNYSRDASITTYGDKYVVAYTDDLLSTNGTFGVAVSSNLVDWTYVSSPRASNATLITNTINNTWAPEWFVENGEYYVVVRIGLTTNTSPNVDDTLNAPGHGYMKCNDPGTWTNWAAFQPIGGFTNTNANDVAIAKFGDTYHLFWFSA